MDDGREILKDLQASGVADRGLDYDEVMAELAKDQSALRVISPDRHRASFLVRLRPGESDLIDELVAIARAPFLALPWPPTPPVPLERLKADFERTTSKAMELALRWEQYPDNGLWLCDVALDGRFAGSCGVEADEDDPEGSLVAVADRMCEGWLHEEIWGGWPTCRRHPSRPMWATKTDDGVASWQCEADSTDAIAIGELGL